MAAPTDPAKFDHAIELYLSGQTLKQAASGAGVTTSPLLREMKRRGIPRRTRRLETPPDLVERYLTGESELQLSESYGIARNAVRRQLLEAGVEPRGMSDAGKSRAYRMTADERAAQARAANEAVRGVPAREDRLMTAAQTRAAKAAAQSEGEERLLRFLEQRGLAPGVQTAVGRYNVDITVADVAVEVLGGKWHGRKSTHELRTKALLDRGWHVVFVWDHDRCPLGTGAADYIVSVLQETGGDPSTPRQYRVIRGDGQLVAAGSSENYQLTVVPPANKTSRRRRRDAG